MGSPQFPALDSAIITAEGYGTPNYAYPNSNNPFDLQPGGVETTYPSYQAGVMAGDSFLQNIATGGSKLYSPSESLSQFGATYSGGDPNFASNLSKSLGISLSTPMSDVFTATQANQNNPQSFSMPSFDPYTMSPFTSDPNNPILNQLETQNSQLSLIKGNWWTLWDPARWAFALVGGAMIIGGLSMFRQTAVIIEKGANVVAKAKELVA